MKFVKVKSSQQKVVVMQFAYKMFAKQVLLCAGGSLWHLGSWMHSFCDVCREASLGFQSWNHHRRTFEKDCSWIDENSSWCFQGRERCLVRKPMFRLSAEMLLDHPLVSGFDSRELADFSDAEGAADSTDNEFSASSSFWRMEFHLRRGLLFLFLIRWCWRVDANS